MRGKRIAMLGYYGAGNLGDDLMLHGMLAELLAADADVVIYVISYYRQPMWIPESPRVRVVRVASPLAKFIRLGWVFLRCRAACFGGGTPFTDTEGDGSYKFFRLARVLGCRFGYVGVGIGRLQRPERRRRAAWLLARCDFSGFRDPESLRRACDLVGARQHMELTEDLAYLAVGSRALPKWRGRGGTAIEHLVISWRELRGEEGFERDALLAKHLCVSIRSLIEQRGTRTVTLLPLDNTMDHDAHYRLRAMLLQHLPDIDVAVERADSVERMLDVMAGADLYISVRLHGAFMAKTMGVPTVGFAYSPKVEYYFRSIGSASLLSWQTLETQPECLGAAAATAMDEARTPLELSHHVEEARKNIAMLLRAVS